MMRFNKLGFNEASAQNAQLVEYLVRTVGRSPKLQMEAPNMAIMQAVGELLQNEETLSRGDALSTILRLPLVWQAPLLEYVQKSKPYSVSPNLHSTLMNVSNRTVRVFIAEHRVPKYSAATGALIDDYDIRKLYTNLEPGEIVELDSNYAVHALYDHGRYSASVPQWSRMGAAAFEARPLVEVAYRAEWHDIDFSSSGALPVKGRQEVRRVTVNSAQWQLERVHEIVEAAKAAKSQNESAAIIKKIWEGWPITDELQKLQTKLEK